MRAYSMFVKYFGHKGPRLEARPWLMAAFYEFKAAVSDLNFHNETESGARKPACAKFAGAATLKERQMEGVPTRLAALSGKYR